AMVRAYLVCATPRSGSTLVCEALKGTGVAGRPEEYFEAVPATGRLPRPADYLEGLDDAEALALVGGAPAREPPPYSSLEGVGSYDEHVARALEWGTTPNGVFGAKLMWDHVGRLPALGDPRYVWVRRGDVVRQAVSLWRAMQTQSWRDDSTDGEGGQHAPQYSFAALRHLVARLTDHDARWREFLAGAPVLEVTYEELTADLPGVIRRTLDHVGVADSVDIPQPAMRRQADELSEAWVAAYARDQEPLMTST
ncbi:MAG TPA: Stf0 family sulfotransferase, partial [Solirubrobacteraceae bacterium]|nr:Stf0 family sulfotransferase [Solirubrobacteraceae bacterium]